MDVYWLEQIEADVPSKKDWLSASEQVCQNGLRFAKRLADWQLGRWTSKRALAHYFRLPADAQVLAKIEIRSAASGAPEVFFAGRPAAVTISLSHRAGRAVCAVAPADVAMGCDLELIEPRSEAFISDYFTVEEQTLIAKAPASDQAQVTTLLWSGKESALKALRAGLRLDTRSVVVSLDDASFDLNGWSPLHVRHNENGRIFHGWWQHSDNLLRTLVADSPPGSPIPLKVMAHLPDHSARCA